jgi:hypothetical protein
MDPRRRSLLLLIAFGGAAVLGSYVLAFVGTPELRSGLWGELPEPLKPAYTVNMLLAAVGFFPATYLLGFGTPLDELERLTGLRFEAMIGAYAAILMPSALWLPLTALYLQAPSPLLWIAIRGVLFLVGLGATALGTMLIRRARHGPPLAWGAVAAFAFFWLQTMVLDAIVWPWFHHG